MPSFWNTSVFSSKVFSPLVRVLCLVNKETKPPMGYIYKAMNRAKKTIITSFNENEENTRKPSKSLIRGGRFSFMDLCMLLGTF